MLAWAFERALSNLALLALHVLELFKPFHAALRTESKLQSGAAGKVVVVRNEMGRSRGFGFVEFQEDLPTWESTGALRACSVRCRKSGI